MARGLGETKGTARAMQSHEAAFRSRLGGLDTYRAPKDEGGPMPTHKATADTVRRLGGNSGPRKFAPIKT